MLPARPELPALPASRRPMLTEQGAETWTTQCCPIPAADHPSSPAQSPSEPPHTPV